MARFRMLSENLFNVHQFTGHTITASDNQAGKQSWRVGTGRRSDRDAWIASTTGAGWVKVACDQVRACDMLALDRGHNINSLSIQFTNSTAAGWTTHETVTIPTVTSPNQALTDTPGTRTPEGAWVYRFATTASMPVAKFWRLNVSTTGGGTKPKIVGAYLGKSFSPSNDAVRPWDDGPIQLQRQEVASPELWTVSSQVGVRRTGSLTSRLTDKEGDQAEYHVRDLYWKGQVAWIAPHADQAHTALLATAPSGTRDLSYPDDWPTRVLTLDWVEHQPKPL